MPRPTDKQIEDQINESIERNGEYAGMSYEEGVDAALRWAKGETDEVPMEMEELD